MTLIAGTADVQRADPVVVLDPDVPAERPAAGVASDAEQRALAAAVRRISAELPDAAETEVVRALAEHLEATREAKVQNFRLLLAERHARARLRSR